MKTIDVSDEDAIRELFLGHRVVEVEVYEDGVNLDGVWRWAKGKMTLDNGREVFVTPNEGCGGCPAGYYDLTSLERVDNIITRVDFEVEVKGDKWSDEKVYRIFVLAGHERINALTVEGDDGNGYYGTGYELVVKDPLGLGSTEQARQSGGH